MINSRDTYTDFNPSRKESIEVPYGIATIIELKDNPDILARICQYRIIVENLKRVIYVGLNTNVSEEKQKIDYEITTEELEEKWKKSNRIIIGTLDPKSFIPILGFFDHFEKQKKLELTKKDPKY